MRIYHGRNSQLLLQRETQFRTAPTPAAFLMKFSEFRIRDEEARVEDPTIKVTPLPEKRDESEESIAGTLSAILCLNDIGQWLSLLWGAPVTTGTGPYTHTFTLDLAERPTALLEFGHLIKDEYPRYLGCAVNALAWSIKENEQNFSAEIMGATEVDPIPSAVFDAAPTQYAKDRACSKGGEIYDVQGASTLGHVSAGSIRIANNMEGMHLADGQPGYGAYDLGQPEITGEMTALWTDTSQLYDHQRDHVSRALTLISKNKAGDASLTVNIPNVEFDKPTREVTVSRGVVITAPWRAHSNVTPATIDLVNSIATY